MERAAAEKAFMEKCYDPLFRSWMQEVTEQYGAEFQKNETRFVTYIEQFLNTVANLQRQADVPLSVITCSILWTSLLEGTPAILIEAYTGEPFMQDPVMGERVPAPWLFYHWSEFLDALSQTCGKMKLGTYIRRPEIRAKAIQAARDLICLYWIAMKAHLRRITQLPVWRSFSKGPLFCITLGEYMERQYALIGERAEVDLALLEPNSSAQFAKFQDRVFRNQKFEGLTLSDTVFQRCIFQYVEFQACALSDAQFVDCTFEHCTFSDLSLMGTEIYATRLTDSSFQRIWSDTGQSREPGDFLSGGHTRFANCLLEKVSFCNAELRHAKIENCQFIKLHVLESDLCASLQDQAAEGV